MLCNTCLLFKVVPATSACPLKFKDLVSILVVFVHVFNVWLLFKSSMSRLGILPVEDLIGKYFACICLRIVCLLF